MPIQNYNSNGYLSRSIINCGWNLNEYLLHTLSLLLCVEPLIGLYSRYRKHDRLNSQVLEY